jgi:hypothetical protein
MTDQVVTTSIDELLAAVSHLTDEDLLLLRKVAFRLANELSEESARPRVVEVIGRWGVFLAEEQDTRRGSVEHARRQADDGCEFGWPLSGEDDRPDSDTPCTD